MNHIFFNCSFFFTVNWARLFLCEMYLAILTGEGGASAGVFLRNFRSILWVRFFGEKKLVAIPSFEKAAASEDEFFEFKKVEFASPELLKPIAKGTSLPKKLKVKKQFKNKMLMKKLKMTKTEELMTEAEFEEEEWVTLTTNY